MKHQDGRLLTGSGLERRRDSLYINVHTFTCLPIIFIDCLVENLFILFRLTDIVVIKTFFLQNNIYHIGDIAETAIKPLHRPYHSCIQNNAVWNAPPNKQWYNDPPSAFLMSPVFSRNAS